MVVRPNAKSRSHDGDLDSPVFFYLSEPIMNRKVKYFATYFQTQRDPQ